MQRALRRHSTGRSSSAGPLAGGWTRLVTTRSLRS
jgi:hypothetical protein